MSNLGLIISREYLSRVRNKTFVTMTFLSPLFFVGMIVVVAYLTHSTASKTATLSVLDESGVFIDQLEDNTKIRYKDFSHLSLQAAIDSTQNAGYTGLIHITEKGYKEDLRAKLYRKGSADSELIIRLENKLSTIVTDQNLYDLNLDISKIEEAQAKISLDIEGFDGEQSSRNTGYIKMIFGGLAGYLLMMFIIIYGNMIMRSVIEEKVNRIIEIIISSVKPLYLMIGKILGTTLAGLTQFLIWMVVGGVLLLIASFFLPFDIATTDPATLSAVEGNAQAEMIQDIITDIVNLPLLTLTLCFLIYFIGGYFLYSSIYAAIGAAVDNETDTQQFMMPIIIPLMLAMYVGFFSVMNEPNGTISVVFSHIPLTSPIVMLMRIPFGVAWWELVISILILAGSIVGTTWLGAKIYRVGILMYGKKPKFKDLIKWLRY